jgi:hypothetical protein
MLYHQGRGFEYIKCLKKCINISRKNEIWKRYPKTQVALLDLKRLLKKKTSPKTLTNAPLLVRGAGVSIILMGCGVTEY